MTQPLARWGRPYVLRVPGDDRVLAEAMTIEAILAEARTLAHQERWADRPERRHVEIERRGSWRRLYVLEDGVFIEDATTGEP